MSYIEKKISDYYAPTPKNLRRLGDALLGVSTVVVGFSIYEEAKWVAIVALVFGVCGKFLTNFFNSDNNYDGPSEEEMNEGC